MTPSEQAADARFAARCQSIYLSGGLLAFIEHAETYDSNSAAGFAPMLRYACAYYGIQQKALANALEVSPSTITTWMQGSAESMPPTRKQTKFVVLDLLRTQVKA